MAEALLEQWKNWNGLRNVGDGISIYQGYSTKPCHLSVARRKTLFDDRPNEINELTFVIKQDLASLNSQISSLQSVSKAQQAQVSRGSNADQEGEHNKNVGRPAVSVLEND